MDNQKTKAKDLYKYTLDGQIACICPEYITKLNTQTEELQKKFEEVNNKRVPYREINGQLIDKFVNEQYCFKVSVVRPNPFISNEGKLVQVCIPQKNMRDPGTNEISKDEYIVNVMDKDQLVKSQSIKINVLKTVKTTDLSGKSV